MKSPSPLVRHTVDGMLSLLKAKHLLGSRIPTEAELAAALEVSRSPVRAAAQILLRRGVLKRDGTTIILNRAPRRSDRFGDVEAPVSKRENFAKFFLERLQQGQLPPGHRFSELELARTSGLTTVTVREGLARYARFGLIE